MTLRTLIVDDEAPARRRMLGLIGREPDCELVGQAESGREAIRLIRRFMPDLVLLDIQLKDRTGFEVMEAVKGEFKGALIFITAFDEHAIHAFEINAIDYLLKPFKNQRFAQAIDRARKLLRDQQQPRVEQLLEQLQILQASQCSTLRIPEGKTTHFIQADQLEFIRADGAYCRFHSSASPKTIRISLKKVAAMLPEYFIRISRSVIINRKKVSSVKRLKNSVEVAMEGGAQFVAARTYSDLRFP